ncbi:hypothetical protein GM182_07435 [bacterium 3DAC]|nr:hypothetical protein GM182_07435 [bacterium 3DAC]
MKTLTLTEWTPHPYPKKDNLAQAIEYLVSENIIKVIYTASEKYIISEGKVGTAKIGDTTIHIKPHLENAELISMIAYALYMPPKWYEETKGSTLQTYLSLPDIIAMIFCEKTRHLIRRGLQKQYIRQIAESNTISGRPQMRHITRYIPFTGKLPTIKWYRKENTILNMLTLSTAYFLYRYTQSASAKEKLSEIIDTLENLHIDIHPLRKSLLSDAKKVVNRNTMHYLPIIRIAELLLRGIPQTSSGNTSFSGFFLDMAKLFELATLRYLKATHSHVEYQKRINIRSGIKAESIRPDFVIDKKNPADAKYRPFDKMGKEVIYQVLTYAMALGSKKAFVYYPGDTTEYTQVHLQNQTVDINWIGIRFQNLLHSSTSA